MIFSQTSQLRNLVISLTFPRLLAKKEWVKLRSLNLMQGILGWNDSLSRGNYRLNDRWEILANFISQDHGLKIIF